MDGDSPDLAGDQGSASGKRGGNAHAGCSIGLVLVGFLMIVVALPMAFAEPGELLGELFSQLGQLTIMFGIGVLAFGLALTWAGGSEAAAAEDELGTHEFAIADASEAIDSGKADADTYVRRGYSYGRIGEYELAIADLDRAVELAPMEALLYNDRGFARAKAGDIAGASADFDHALTLAFDPAVIKQIEDTRRRAGLGPE